MSDHRYRRSEGVSAYRQFFRDNFPNGSQGWAIEDIDGCIRRFDPSKPGDFGRLILVEEKSPSAPKMTHGQWMTYAMLDSLLRRADPERSVYWGFVLIVAEDWERGTWWEVNGVRLARQAFIDFFHGSVPLRPMNFSDPDQQARFSSKAGALDGELVPRAATCPVCHKPVRGGCRCVF